MHRYIKCCPVRCADKCAGLKRHFSAIPLIIRGLFAISHQISTLTEWELTSGFWALPMTISFEQLLRSGLLKLQLVTIAF